MIRKKDRRVLFVEAGIVILIVYLLVLGMTYVLDTWRMKELDDQLRTHSLKHESFLASNSFFELMGVTDCNFSAEYILEEYEDIKELSVNIASFKNRILSFNEEKHDLKKREFLIAQTENFNKLKTHNTYCDNKIFPILYFIDGDITGFNQQSLVLQQFVTSHKDEVILYNIDINYYEEPVVKFLLDIHGVKNHNTVVFGNSSNIEGGSMGRGRLMEELERLRGN